MKTKSSELKAQAKKILEGRYGIAVGTMAVIFVCLLLVGSVSGTQQTVYTVSLDDLVYQYGSAGYWVIYGIGALLCQLLMLGQLKLFLNMKSGRHYGFSDLFYAFKNHVLRYVGIYLLMLLLSVAVLIPMLILIVAAAATNYIPLMLLLVVLISIITMIAGIWIQFTYSQAYLVALSYPEESVLWCMRESRLMMAGNKGRYFYLNLSFLGMCLLGAMSACIGFLWVLPYITCTQICFYEDLRKPNLQ